MSSEECEGYTNYETSRLGILLNNTEEMHCIMLYIADTTDNYKEFQERLEDNFFIDQYEIYSVEEVSFDEVTWGQINFYELYEDWKETLNTAKKEGRWESEEE